MKINTLIILFIFVVSNAFSQEKKEIEASTVSTSGTQDSIKTKVNYSKWIIDIGAGISNGTRPYNNGYYTSVNNQLFNSFVLNCYTIGARHNFSQHVGIKMDLAFDRFINNTDNKSKPFEVGQYRTSFQAIYNLNKLVKAKNNISRINLIFHGGFQLARIIPIAADYNKKVSNGDNYGGIVFGLTPTIRISKKTAIYLDFSAFSNYGQNLTWNGKHNVDEITNSVGNMYAATFGLSFTLDKKQL